MSVFLKNLDLSSLAKKKKRSSASDESTTRKRSSKASTQQVPFPVKLHQMLREVEEQGLESIVSWQHDGLSFRVHRPEKFVDDILPSYFRCSKMKSFQRQLNFYKFIRVVGGPLEGSYSHPAFIRGNEELAATIKRHNEPRSNSSESDLSSKPEPDSISVNSDDATDDYQLSSWEATEASPEVEKSPVEDRRDSLQEYLEANFGGLDLGPRESFREGKRFSFVGKKFFFLPVEFTDLYEVSSE